MNREYCTLQRNLKDYRAMGYDVKVKLNAKAEVLLAEVVRIEKLVEAAKTEVIDTEVELAEEYRMEGCELLDYPVVTATAEELEALEVAYQAPESHWIESKAEPVVDHQNADEVVANCISYRFKKYQTIQEHSKDLGRHGMHCDGYEYNSVVQFGYDVTVCGYACSLASKPKVEVEPYTEAMSAEDDELTSGVVVDSCDLPLEQDLRTYKAVWYNDEDVHCEGAVTWYCTYEEALIKLEKLNNEGHKGKRYLACYLEGSELPYGHQYGATWEPPQPYIHPDLGLVNGSSLVTVSYDLDTDEYYVDDEGVVRTLDGDVEVVFDIPQDTIDLTPDYCKSYELTNVEGLPVMVWYCDLNYKDGWEAYLEAKEKYSDVFKRLADSDHIEDYETNFYWGCKHDRQTCPCGRMTANDCAGECGVMEPVETITLSEDEFKQVCEEHGFTCDDSSMMWADVKKALLQDDDFKAAYDVTPDLRQAFKDTTAHYRVNHREPLLVAAINNTYGFLTSKLVTKTLRSAWFWSYASLCVLWAMVQLTWQGLKLAARVTYEAYKLATSPKALALYDLVITQTLTILCNLTGYAETRWRLLWGFLDAGIELAIGLLPKRQPSLVKVQYFLD